MSEEPIIRVENLTKRYKGTDKDAIDNVSFEVPRGRIFGLLGPNGAGKTTMIRILCGLLAPTSGDITVNGYSLKNEKSLIKKLIGVVPQEIALYPTLTARENLVIFGGVAGLKGSELTDRINNWLSIFGLDKSRNHQVRNFSGGMKRRLNLIAGLIHNPAILILDEPTVGVDVHSKNVIIENLFEINQKGTTIIYTSHYLEEAENLCSCLAIIDEGIIIKRGSLHDIRNEYGGNAKLEDVFLQLTGRELRD